MQIILNTHPLHEKALEVHGNPSASSTVNLDTSGWANNFLDDLAYIKLVRHKFLGVRNIIFTTRNKGEVKKLWQYARESSDDIESVMFVREGWRLIGL